MDSVKIIRANSVDNAQARLEDFYNNGTYSSIEYVTQSGSDNVFVYTIHYAS